VYSYLEKLCDSLLVRGLRVPNCDTRKPEKLAVHLLALLVPAMVRILMGPHMRMYITHWQGRETDTHAE
jgi:hypothetical protein